MRALLAMVVLLAACDVPRAGVRLKLVTQSCEAAPELAPLENAAKLRFTVTGDGIGEMSTTIDRGSGSVELPDVATGANRRVVVEALQSDNATVVSRGEAGPFTLEAAETEQVRQVVLRRVDTFTPFASVASPPTCTRLTSARAGHTTTLLGDGRLLVAGGYREEGSGLSSVRVYLDSTELIDPRTSTVTAGPRLERARAFHTATRVPGTTLTVIAGGEAANAASAIGLAEIFDESSGRFTTRPMRQARTDHVAAATTLGGLVLVGGTDAIGNGLMTTEVFDAQAVAFEDGPTLSLPLTLGAAVALDATRILAAGGPGDMARRHSTVVLLRFESGRWRVSAPEELGLEPARAHASLALLPGGDVLALGGVDGIGASSGALNLVLPSEGTTRTYTATLHTARARAGAVSLRDGSVLVSGGASAKAPVERVRITGSNEPVLTAAAPHELGGARNGTWTLLDDGTVFAIGGETDAGVLDVVGVFQPAY